MSNHLHLLISATESSNGISSIIRDFKKYTSKQLISKILKSKQESRREWMQMIFKYHAKFNKNNATYQFWQHDNRPMICVHPKFTAQKLFYIHDNPVRAGIVENTFEYYYSSAKEYQNYLIRELEIDRIDFGQGIGYVMT